MNRIKNTEHDFDQVVGFLFLSEDDLKICIQSKIISVIAEESINRISSSCIDEAIVFDNNNKFISNPLQRKIYRIGLSYDFIFDYETYNYDVPDEILLYDLTKYARFLDVIDLDIPNTKLVEEFSKIFPEIIVTSEQNRQIIHTKSCGLSPTYKVRKRVLIPTNF